MHIKLKNKKLLFSNYKVKCAIGKRGISSKKREGDSATPRGIFKFKELFYRKDRVKFVKTKLKKKQIYKNLGWCDDSKSKFYNKLIKFPFKYRAEKLYLKSHVYDIIITLNFNLNPVIKKKGSAIFLHLAKKNYSPTKGCIAVSLKDMRLLLNKINKKTKLYII
ncbi:MAG: L,D-transpeptidase [Pelagibacteraceae bacterium]